MRKDNRDLMFSLSSRQVAYYNLPRGNDRFRSYTCCDDENARADSNINLPEQHFQRNK